MRNELGGLYYSLSKDTDIDGSHRPWFCKTSVLYRKTPSSPGTEWETRRTRATAAQGVPDTFRGETVITCVTADSFTAFHYMRNWVWTVSSLNIHWTAFRCINTFTFRPTAVSLTAGPGIFPHELDFDVASFEVGLKRRSVKQSTVSVCCDSFKLWQATLKVSVHVTSVGENRIYMHRGNRPSLDRIVTSTTGDRTGIWYLNWHWSCVHMA